MKSFIKNLLKESLTKRVLTENKGYDNKDLKKYESLHNKHKGYKNNYINLSYYGKDPLIDDLKKYDFPNGLFSFLIDDKRPDLVDYFPYDVELHSTECEHFPDNEWTNKDGFLGLNEGPKLRLFVPVHKDVEVLPILWMLFHEFRHKMQHEDENIASLTSDENPNKEKLFDFINKETGADRNMMNHVFHEIDPMEIDANIFASEILGVEYKGSGKFDITDETIKKLKK